VSDGSLTQDEINALLSGAGEEYKTGIDRRHEKENSQRRKKLIKNAMNAKMVVKAVRDLRGGVFTLSDEDAENLILHYGRNWNSAPMQDM
jgi:hypothetical protein